jgi:hypothetical protein
MFPPSRFIGTVERERIDGLRTVLRQLPTARSTSHSFTRSVENRGVL